MTPPLALATLGPVTDINNMSGTSYFFWRTAERCGYGLRVVDLPATKDFWMRRALWDLGRFIKDGNPRGFTWSNPYLELAWKSKLDYIRDYHLLSKFQLVSTSVLRLVEAKEVELSFYVDLTLKELFAEYHEHSHLGKDVTDSAIQLESKGYRAAKRVFVCSNRSAETLRRDYNIDRAKIEVVVPGANIDEDAVAAYSLPPPWNGDREFVIGFVGMDYIRKGLLPLAKAVSQLRGRGIRVRLRVIGPEPSTLKNIDGIDLIGRIDKTTQMEKFVDLLAHCDLGALPTVAEGLGISLREFLRLGIPVLSTNVGGVPDATPSGAGIILHDPVNAESLAAELEKIISSQPLYDDLKHTAVKCRDDAKWCHAVVAIMAALGYPVP